MYLTGERMFAMKNKKKLPVGIESFYEIIQQNFYYVDKTQMIADLLYNWGKVNLFTRPRRFGKSLNVSILKLSSKSGATRLCLKDLQSPGKQSSVKNTWENFLSFPSA